jgi:sugar O-acyltransferase (sialic acid O-acetyltransferase NeuD family)
VPSGIAARRNGAPARNGAPSGNGGAPKRRLYLCGAGNSEGVRLALRVNERERRWDELVLLDDDPAKHGLSQLGVRVAGPFSLLADADPATSEAVNLIARTTARRQGAGERIASFGVPFASLISSDVDLLGAEVGYDLMAYQNATVGPEVVIGDGSVIFMGAVAGHECHVGHHCVLAANSVLNARVVLHDGVYVGSNAVVLPEIEVGAGATIGAGAVVIADVPAGATVMTSRVEVMQQGAHRVRQALPADLVGALSGLWCEVLGVGRIDPRQNFFDAGGTSLLALRLLQQVEETLGVSLRPVDLYQNPSIATMAAHMQAADNSTGMRAFRGPMGQAHLRAELRRQMLGVRDARPALR